MGMLKLIEWNGATRDNIVYRYDIKDNYITRGSKLTVREGQACVFCHKGKMADVFLPGMYTLDTNNVPLLTKLLSWKYGFESPFKSDVFFVNTTQFTNQKWGTLNPIIIRDADYGAVRIRAFGTYAFKVDDPFVFMQEISGTLESYSTKDISDYLRSMLVMGITDAIGEAKIPILDMAANLIELGRVVKKSLEEDFAKIGLKISAFNFENFSLPEALQEALDKNTALGMQRQNMDVYMAKAQADALVKAAENPGMAGTTMGAGIGMGMGMQMGNMFANNMNNAGNLNNQQNAGAGGSVKCPKCGASLKPGAKFCSECGEKLGAAGFCPKCGAQLKPGAKFCSECGEKL